MAGHELLLNIQQTGGVRVININGAVMDRLDVERVTQRISDEVGRGDAPRIVICFDRIKEVSSAILGAVLKIDKQVRQRNGKLRLSGMQPNVQEVFRLTRLDTILDIHADSAEAVSNFD